MPRYERVDGDGKVTERVHTVEGSHEDTRLGLAALEDKDGWRVAAEPTAEQPSSEQAAARTPATGEAAKEGGEGGNGVRDSGGAGRVARPRAGT